MSDGTTNPARPGLSDFELALFRALQQDGRVPFTTLAEQLDVSEAHVRRTVKQLVASDVIAITAVADPRLLGLRSMAWITLVVRHAHMQEVARQLSEMPEVDYVVMTTGVWNVMAETACFDHADLYRFLTTVRALTGVQRTESYQYLRLLRQQFQWTNRADDTPLETPAAVAPGVRAGPPELDELDVRVIGELQQDGRASFRDIGGRLGVSERVVSTRVARLAEENVARVIAVGNPSALGFNGLAWLGIQLTDDAEVEAVAAGLGTIPQVSYLVSASGRYDLMAELVCRDREHLISTLSTKVGTVAGIDTVETSYYLRLLYRNAAGAWGAARARSGELTPIITKRASRAYNTRPKGPDDHNHRPAKRGTRYA